LNRERRWKRWTVGLAAATGLAAAAAAVFGIRTAQLSDQRDELLAEVDSVRSVLTAPDAETVRADLAGGTATIVAAPSLGRTLIMGQQVAEPQEGETFQAWVIDTEGAHSAGTFEPNAQGQVVVELAAPAAVGDTIGVTVEPDGGSEQPTSEPILAVPIGEA
jgi:anti-sigma-K factor RskA